MCVCGGGGYLVFMYIAGYMFERYTLPFQTCLQRYKLQYLIMVVSFFFCFAGFFVRVADTQKVVYHGSIGDCLVRVTVFKPL